MTSEPYTMRSWNPTLWAVRKKNAWPFINDLLSILFQVRETWTELKRANCERHSVVSVSMCFIDKMAGLSAIVLLAIIAAVSGDTNSCNPEKMSVYRMVLHTYWTREKFPKHYPDWRPPAQWSKVYGKLLSSLLYTYKLNPQRDISIHHIKARGMVSATFFRWPLEYNRYIKWVFRFVVTTREYIFSSVLLFSITKSNIYYKKYKYLQEKTTCL